MSMRSTITEPEFEDGIAFEVEMGLRICFLHRCIWGRQGIEIRVAFAEYVAWDGHDVMR